MLETSKLKMLGKYMALVLKWVFFSQKFKDKAKNNALKLRDLTNAADEVGAFQTKCRFNGKVKSLKIIQKENIPESLWILLNESKL